MTEILFTFLDSLFMCIACIISHAKYMLWISFYLIWDWHQCKFLIIAEKFFVLLTVMRITSGVKIAYFYLLFFEECICFPFKYVFLIMLHSSIFFSTIAYCLILLDCYISKEIIYVTVCVHLCMYVYVCVCMHIYIFMCHLYPSFMTFSW